ncbi:MAG: hypothetical protein JWP97_4602 [Labilithrix sp.]|nr:hypothetical protein [Labilithrix sp.]
MRRVVDVPPRFAIVPVGLAAPPGRLPILLEESDAFGDGSHPTTAVCLEAVGALAPRRDSWSMLDVGSGTGVLAIAAARLGAREALGVEIDDAALATAARNAALNGVAERVRFGRALPSTAHDLVVANILRGVLVQLAAPLVACVAGGGTLVLSGLTSTDVPEVSSCYARALGGHRPEIYERGEWRALAWRAVVAAR